VVVAVRRVSAHVLEYFYAVLVPSNVGLNVRCENEDLRLLLVIGQKIVVGIEVQFWRNCDGVTTYRYPEKKWHVSAYPFSRSESMLEENDEGR
jgi:hypothetical protein